MIDITGIPFYDGVIEGMFYVPWWIADKLTMFNIYNVGFWCGIILFFGIILKLLLWGGGYDS
jgi:hypothetical protein